MKSNVILEGNGATIKKNGNFSGISAIGSLGNEITDIGLHRLTFTRDAADMHIIAFIDWQYVLNGLIKECIFENFVITGIRGESSQLVITQNAFRMTTIAPTTSNLKAMQLFLCDGSAITLNTIIDLQSRRGIYAIDLVYTNDVHVEGNHITNCRAGIDGEMEGACEGIRIIGDNNRIIGNRIKNMDSYWVDYDMHAIAIYRGEKKTQLKNNTCIDNGNLIDRGNCESATSPMFTGETVPLAPVRAIWAKREVSKYEGAASWLLRKTSAAGSGDAQQYLQDTILTNDMHGLIAALEYTISCYGKVPAAGAIARYTWLLYEYYSADWHETGNAPMTGINAWEALIFTVTLNAATTGIILFPNIDTDEAVNSKFYLDNLRIQPIGVHNEHDQNFSDAGVGTFESGCSWQVPF
ncbi:hypothetical protein ES703_52860 [subsurface metagenome]